MPKFISCSATAYVAAAGDSLTGLDTTGTLWRRAASGDWGYGGTVAGTPQALLAGETRIYVADDRGIVFTDDLGGSWIVPVAAS